MAKKIGESPKNRGIFISYAHAQKAWVRRFYADLKKLLPKTEIFLDAQSISPGESLASALQRGLSESHYLILCVSPESMASRWVQDEIDTSLFKGMTTGGRLIPVVLNWAPMPDFVEKKARIEVATAGAKGYRLTLEQLIAVVTGSPADASTKKRIAALTAPSSISETLSEKLFREVVDMIGGHCASARDCRTSLAKRLNLPPHALDDYPNNRELAANAAVILVSKTTRGDHATAALKVLAAVREGIGGSGEDIKKIDALVKKIEAERRRRSNAKKQKAAATKELKSAGAAKTATPARSLKSDSPDILSGYLRIVADDHRTIAPLFSADDLPIETLDEIYVDVAIDANERSEVFALGHDLTLERLVRLGAPEPFADDRSMAKADAHESKIRRRWIVRGDPGSGKTTILRQLANRLADEKSKRPVDLVPVFFHLPEIVRGDAKTKSVPTMIAERLQSDGGVGAVGPQAVTALLGELESAGRLVFFLDSLDEVPAGLRDNAVERIRGIGRSYPRSAVIVTSRKIGFHKFDPDYTVVDLRPLEEKLQVSLLSKWLRENRKDVPDEKRARAVLASLGNSQSIRTMTGSPLLLTLIAVLVRSGIKPEKSRPRLYDQIFNALIDRRHGAKGDRDPLDSGALVREALGEIAYLMTEKDRLAMPRAEIEALFDDPCMKSIADRLRSSSNWKTNIAKMLNDVSGRTGILGPHDSWKGGIVNAGDWKFWHKGFQEALCAESMRREYVAQGLKKTLKRIRGVKGQEGRWAEPLALLVARLDDPNAAILELTAVDRSLGLRALAGAEGVDPKTVLEILKVTHDDIEDRRRLFLGLPETIKNDEILIPLLLRIAHDTTDGNDLWFVREVLTGLLEKARKQKDAQLITSAEDALSRMFAHLGRPTIHAQSEISVRGRRLRLWAEIPGGSFLMGSPDDEEGRDDDEGPQHRVTLSPFRLGIVPITKAMYREFDPNHECTGGDDHPVTEITWYAASAFVAWLGQSIPGASLPTEAQWEYACRAGTTTRFWCGDAEKDLERVGWYEVNGKNRVQPVALKDANPFGLFDMHGNVWDWCSDWFGAYSEESSTNPTGPATGGLRVMRGGSAWYDALWARSAYRFRWGPAFRYVFQGFRVAFPASGDR